MGDVAPQPAREEVNVKDSRSDSVDPRRRRAHICVDGVVQGVGFRPYVYRLATELGLAGWVRNTSRDVRIEVEGPHDSVREFIRRLPAEAPPLASIHRVVVGDSSPCNTTRFDILESTSEEGGTQLVSPDIATCPACLAELGDHTDRRYRYPFTNCTSCGPRFTIITDMPYDRPNTTMATFTMCPACRAEYDNPANRRFHAQPNACPVCGPSLHLTDAEGKDMPCADVIARTASLLGEGKIVALKGLGGFLLVCDATVPAVVQELRARKHRPSKPFAVMVRNVKEARLHCELTAEEETLLQSPAAPIVLARWRRESSICPETAPGLAFLGIMLPYTPMHHILLGECSHPLVMTSGNLSEEPIAAENQEALTRLGGIADYFVLHDRPIHSRYDDSVLMVAGGHTHMLRRARGYAPHPIELVFDSPPVLAVGSHTKNTFCLATGRRAFVSQHIGDLDSIETLDHFEHTIELYRKLFRIDPSVVAHDLHPDYASTSFARRLADEGHATHAVQHHHAHIVSCMVENRIEEPVIGVAFDGAGLGSDGHVWGGEFLVCDASVSRRAGHLEYLPLPGGDAATIRPYRIAAAYVAALFGEQHLGRSRFLKDVLTEDELRVIVRQVETRFNTPLTSSMGRLFDCVAALAGVRNTIDYDGQAAIELEMQAHRHAGKAAANRYSFGLERLDDIYVIGIAPLLDSILRDVSGGVATPLIAASLHEAVARMTVDVCSRIARETGLHTVALSGGVFQNRLLIESLPAQLRNAGFRVLTHVHLPPNDGCVSLGQAAVAASAR